MATKAKEQEIKVPDGFITISTDAYVWKADHGVPVRGWILNKQDFPGNDTTRPFSMLLVKTTEATKGEEKDENNVKHVVDVPAGEHVMVVVNHGLKLLEKAAMHPDKCVEVFIAPKAKQKIGGGRTVWKFDIAISPHVKLRAEISPALQMAEEAMTRFQLTSGD